MDTAETPTTRALPFDANATLLTTALSEDLNLTAANVDVDCCDAQLGRKWTITFEDGEDFCDRSGGRIHVLRHE